MKYSSQVLHGFLFILFLSVIGGCQSKTKPGTVEIPDLIGTWREIRPENNKTIIIMQGPDDTYLVDIPPRKTSLNDEKQHYDGFRWSAGQHLLFRGKDHQMEIRYDTANKTLQAFVNGFPQTKPMEKLSNTQ